jgi:hypothetical protein
LAISAELILVNRHTKTKLNSTQKSRATVGKEDGDVALRSTGRRLGPLLWSWQPLNEILRSSKQRTQLILTLAFGLLACWTMVTMAFIDIRAYSALPWGDHWDHWRLVLKDGYSLGTFVHLHNEHRILVPRLFFMIDHLLFGASNVFIFVSICLVQLGHALLLWRISARASGPSPPSSLALGSLVTIALFSQQQFSNFTWAFQIQFVGVYFLATAALYALMRVEDSADSPTNVGTSSAGWLLSSLVFAWGATYTMSSGLFLWPILLLFSFALHLRWPHVVWIAVNGLIAWIVYLHGFHTPSQHISPLASLFDPPRVLAFALAYLGAPVDDTISAISKIFALGGDNYRTLWAAAAGFVGLLSTIILLLRSLEKRKYFNDAQLLLIYNALFILVTAFVTSAGRGIQFQVIDALTSRYSTPALVFWSCLLALLWSARVGRANAGSVQPTSNFQLGVLVALFLLVAINQTPRFEYVRGYNAYLGEVEAAITARVYDEPVWKRVYYDPSEMRPVVQYFWQNHLSVFGHQWTRWQGKHLKDLFPVAQGNPPCVGWFDEVTFVPSTSWPGFRTVGWAWDPEFRSGPGKVLLVNEKGIIAGIASNMFQRPDVNKAQPSIASLDVGWRGYLTSSSFHALDAYLVRKDAHVCKVGSIRFDAPLEFARTSDVGKVYPNSVVMAGGGWVKNGFYPDVGRAPLLDEAFGSWNGSDKNTGTISIGPFLVPKGTSTIALPVVTGPNANKSSIKIVDEDTGKALTGFSPLQVIPRWLVLKFTFEPLRKDSRLTLIGSDDGAEFGQWLAIGQPHEVNTAQ